MTERLEKSSYEASRQSGIQWTGIVTASKETDIRNGLALCSAMNRELKKKSDRRETVKNLVQVTEWKRETERLSHEVQPFSSREDHQKLKYSLSARKDLTAVTSRHAENVVATVQKQDQCRMD